MASINKWKSIVQQSQASRYKMPEGGVSRAQLAKFLDCEERQVDDVTKDARESGLIKKENRKIYNPANKRVEVMSVYFDTSGKVTTK